MRHRFVLPLALAGLAAIGGCGKQVTSATTASPNLVRVEFEGAICHILGQTPTRSVLIDDANHESLLLILKPTKIGKDSAESEQRLRDALPTGYTPSCDPNFCEVTPLKGLLMQVVDNSGGAIQPALDASRTDFAVLVPHLSKIATIPNISDLLDDPTPSGDFAAFFELNGGTFSATPYCEPVELKKPDGTSLGEIDFGRTILLTGSTATTPQLQFSSDGKTWKGVTMDRATVLNLRIQNNPKSTHAKMPHLDLHKKIAKGAVNDFPAPTTVKLCQAGTAVGCSNTQWP